MIHWQNFTTGSVHATIFTPDASKFSAVSAVAAVLTHSHMPFDGKMQVLPIPKEAPGDIPHVTLQNSDGVDGQRILSMAPLRVESAWRSNPQGNPLPAAAALECADVLERYVDATRAQVSRLALIVNRRCPIANPAAALIARFCNDESKRQPFDRSESFEIHNHKVYNPGKDGINYRINSWVRCRSARITGENTPIVWVEQDLNTLAEETQIFDSAKIHEYFTTALSEADEIFRKYFSA